MGDAAEILGISRTRTNSYAMPKRQASKKKSNQHLEQIRELLIAAGVDVNLERQVERIDKRPAIKWVRKKYYSPMRPSNDINAPIWRMANAPEVNPKSDPFAESLVRQSSSITFCESEYGSLPKKIQKSEPWTPESTKMLFKEVHEVGSRWPVVSDRLQVQGIDQDPLQCRQRYYIVATEIIKMRRASSASQQLHCLESSPYDPERDAAQVDELIKSWNSVTQHTQVDEQKMKSRLDHLKDALKQRDTLLLENDRICEDDLLAPLKTSKPTVWRGPSSRVSRTNTRFLTITSLKNDRRAEAAIRSIEVFTSTEPVFEKVTQIHGALRKYFNLLDLIKKEEQQVSKLEKDSEEADLEIDLPNLRRIVTDTKLKRKWEDE
eukprot:TRINITY_DN5262_c3_g1_i1.p1 TRINITY_DN5262_c3_g1~~TRINITY_DN5262_c3_g1_i1.p1  ORF type:complete len:378 (+),score=63.57 TRINITY_DN5262_c3_g1_i1:86-1219(+)